MILGFDSNLSYNFNHFMYADDLILISHASRKAARNINLCLNIYAWIIGQNANVSKSAIYFPTWFNSRVSKSIYSILRFKISSFPLTYLESLISPKGLGVSYFKTMVDRISHTCSRWKHSKLSLATKSILINSSILAVSTYYLPVYPIPDSILREITKIVRNFFWDKGGNGKGI